MNMWTFTTLMGFGGMFYLVWIIKTELPKKLKRERKKNKIEWETEIKNKKQPYKKADNMIDTDWENIYKEKNNIIKPPEKNTIKTNIQPPSYSSVTDIANFFDIKPPELNKIFFKLGWAEKSNTWWILTPAGEKQGGKQEYANKKKYIKWDNKIKTNVNLLNTIKEFKNSKINKTKKMTNKEKGDRYEAFIAEHFRELGYYVWEHGKEKGVKDKSIDLIVKKDKDFLFIQCKDWNTWKINHKEVKATRSDLREYLKNKPEFWNLIKNHELKLLYITSKECLTPGAYRYIEENKKIVDYKVIPITA